MYCLSCYAKAIDSTISCSLTAAEYNSNTSTTEIETAHTVTKSVSTDWTRIEVTFLAAKPYVGVKLGVNVSKGTVYFDAFMIEQVQSLDAEASYFRPSGTATYIDGSKIITPNLSTMSANLGMVTAGVIKSNDYSYTSGNFSDNGLILDLNKSYFRSPGFYLSKDGAYFKGELQATSGTLTNLVVDETVYIRNKLKMFCSNELTTRATANTVEVLSLMYDDANQARLTVGNGCSSGVFIPDLYANVLHVQKKGDGTVSDGLLDVSNGTTSGFDGLECEKASYNFIVFKADLFKFKNGIKMCYINSTTGGLSAGTDFKSTNQIPNEYKPTRDFRSTFITKQGKKCIIAVTTASNLWVSAIDSIANTDHFDIAFVYM